MSYATAARRILVAVAALLFVAWATFAAHAEPAPGAAGEVDSRTGGPAIDQSPLAWWSATLENLFRGIDLSASQQAGVDSILEEAALDRARARKLRELVVRSRNGVNPEREQAARAELQELRPRLNPVHRIDAIAELLDPEQREIFDRNRRLRSDRLFKRQRAARMAPAPSPADGSSEDNEVELP